MPRAIKQVENISQSDVFDGKPADGIYFKTAESLPEAEPVISFQFLRFGEEQILEHNSDLEMDRWLVLLFEPIDNTPQHNVVYYSCFIGDALAFSKNHISAGVQGMIVKASVPGYRILLELLRKMDLDIIKEQIASDLFLFQFQHDILM